MSMAAAESVTRSDNGGVAGVPGASVSGLYFSHPDAKYFGIGQIARDQVVDYATRRGEPVAAIEKRLAPNLAYEA